MSAAQDIKQLQKAGFTVEEIGDWATERRRTLTEAGFNQGEIDTYFGQPPFDPKPVIKEVTTQKESATASTAEGAMPKPITDFAEAFEAGFGMSTASLLARPPTKTLSPDAPMASRIAAQVGTLAGDLPALTAGYVIGGMNPVTGTAGAIGLTEGMRRVMMEKYEKGEVTGFADFWERASGAFIDTAKGWITGGVTGVAGKAVGLAPAMMSSSAKSAVTLGVEIPTMVTMGKLLEGQVPEPQDFVDTALVLGAVKGVGATAGKLRTIYEKTAVKPDQVAQDVQFDPTVLPDVLSSNIDTPTAYRNPASAPSVKDIHALAIERDIPFDNSPEFMTFTEQLTGKRHLDDLTPTERNTVASALEEWMPSQPMGGGAPPSLPKNIPVGEAQKAVLDRIVQKDPSTEGLTLEGVYTSIIDNLHPIKKALQRGGKGDLATAENPYDLERLTRGTMGKAQEFLESGAVDFETYATVTKGYLQILNPVKKDLDGFRAYMVAKRAIEKSAQDIETGVPLDEAKVIVKEGAATYEKIHQERIAYRHALLDYLLKSGIVSQKAADAMREANKDYVPFYRFFEEAEAGTKKTGGGSLKRMRGSEREILDPIVSDIKDTFLFISLAEKNAARQTFVQLGPEFAEKQQAPVAPVKLTEPEIQKLFDEFVTVRKQTAKTATQSTTTTGGGSAAPTSKQTAIVVGRVREALLARGFQSGEADQMLRRVGEAEAGKVGATVETIIKEVESTTYIPEMNIRLPNEAATVWRALTTPLKADEIAVFTKGKREVYRTKPEVAEAFTDLDRVSTNLLARMIHAPASALRAGVTITPDFILRNVLRDAVSAFVYAGSNPLKTVLGAKSILTKDTAFHNWMKGGGANATLVAIDRDYISQHLVELDRETGLMRRAWNVAKTPFDLLRATSELIENSTRLGSVRSELMRTQDKARIQALSLLSRESTVDFSRHGRDTQEFAKATAFFNPALQGIDRMNRAFANAPLATSAKALAGVTLPSVLLWWANRDDQEIQDLPRWQKDLFWVTRMPLPGGGSFILRIPKPFELGVVFGSLPERVLDRFVQDNPDAFKDIETSMMQAFLPSAVPTAAVPFISQFANINAFTGQPIIPAHLEQLLPEYQYAPYTTETAKALGRIIGAFPGMTKAAINSKEPLIGGVARVLTTPILLESYLRAWTGGTGLYLLQIADKGLRESGVLPDPVSPAWTVADIPIIKAFTVRYPAASAQSIQDFYASYDSGQRYVATLNYLVNNGDPKAQAFLADHGGELAQLTSIHSTLGETSQLIRLITKNPDISSDEQRQLIDVLFMRMIELSKAGNTSIREMRAAMSEAVKQEAVAPPMAPLRQPRPARGGRPLSLSQE